MSLRVQFKRGASKYIMNHTFDDGEIVINTDTKSIHVGDGETLGGHEIPSKAEIEKIIRNNAISINEDTSMSILALQQDIWSYKADRNYAVGTYVIYQGNIYKCIQAVSASDTHAPTDTDYWTVLLTKAEADSTTHIIETYQNGTSWYRVYSDGWCEQGGYLFDEYTTSGFKDIYYLKPFKSDVYTIVATTTIMNGWTASMTSINWIPQYHYDDHFTMFSDVNTGPINYYASGYINLPQENN